MTELRQKTIESLQLRGLSERTQDSYVRAVRQLADHYHREVAARRRDRGTPFCVSGLPKLWMIVNSPYGSSNGTMNADVQLVVDNQSFPAAGTGGRLTTNSECTGSGTFRVAALNLEVAYNFIATDGGNQIELLSTNRLPGGK